MSQNLEIFELVQANLDDGKQVSVDDTMLNHVGINQYQSKTCNIIHFDDYWKFPSKSALVITFSQSPLQSP